MKINNKIINYRNIILVLLIFQIFISTIIIEATMNPHVDKTNFFTNTTKSSPISADISGNELYAEQITINIAGKNSLIKHSFLTNDTNIFNKIDFSDPSFDGCSFMFSISNDIHPKLDPNPSSNNEIQTIKLSYGSLSGFLYYDINSDYELMNIKKSRLINILKDVFEVDLIFHNEIENKTLGYYYPFYGVIPNIHNFFDITLSKIPKDGYWGSFNLDRILSENYLNNNHLSSSIIFLNQYNLSQSQLNNISKDIDINFDTTPLESSNSLFDLGVNTDNGIGISENTMNDNPNDLIPSENDDINIQEEEENSEDDYSYLDKLENALIFSVQYEGENSALEQNNKNIENSDDYNQIYDFNLFKILNYSGSSLGISTKCYNTLDGISLSILDLGFFSSEIITTSPKFFNFNNYNIQRIESILFLISDDTDISSFKDYSFRVEWDTTESLTRLTTIPQNLHNTSDPINLASLLGDYSYGTGIPGSTIDPIQGFNCTYGIFKDEPSLYISKRILEGNASNILFQNNTPEIEIYVENKGSKDVWGVETDLSLLGITNDPTKDITLLEINQNFFELQGFNTEEIIHTTETLGYNISDLFHHNNPRFFNIDSNNSGSYDISYPDITDAFTNIGIIFPYSPQFTQLLIDNSEVYGPIANNPQLYNSSESIFNPYNWKISPNENFSIILPNPLENVEDKFKNIYSMNISSIENISPIIAIGQEDISTNFTATFIPSDNTSWNLNSESLGNTHMIQTYFLFKNYSIVNFNDIPTNNIDSISFEMLFQNLNNITGINIEIFNYANNPNEVGDEYITLPNFYSALNSENANTIISNTEYNLSNFIDFNNNLSILVRLTFESSEEFSINVDYFQITIGDRINQQISYNPAIIHYESRLGNNYISGSNSILLNTDEASSLTSYIDLPNYNSYCGELLPYNFSISNIGTLSAYNVSIKLTQPGIISNIDNTNTIIVNDLSHIEADVGNFTLCKGILYLNFSEIRPGEIISNLTFYFQIPNSRNLPSAEIKWKSSNYDNINNSIKCTKSNNQYISAPISYNSISTTPKNHELSIQYTSDFSINAPEIGDPFELNMLITNNGNYTLYDIDIPLSYNITGLDLLNNTKNIWIGSLTSNTSIKIKLLYNKTNYRGYMLPQLYVNCSLEQSFLRIKKNNFLIIGVSNIEIRKIYSSYNIPQGKILSVKISVLNIGNIPLGNIIIDDTQSYDANGFRLLDGFMIKSIPYCNPGQSIILEYNLTTLNQNGNYTMNPTLLEYYFIHKNTYYNEIQSVIIRESYLQSILPILVPIIIGLSSLFYTYKRKIKYSKEDMELERRETLLFGQSLRETAWEKKNLISFLENQSEKEDLI